MNTGRYFAVDLESSRIGEGLVSFDYIDVPAYFGEEVYISPKYPISVTLSSKNVKFLLHYCAYRKDGEYYYDIASLGNDTSGIELSHLEECILELPCGTSDPALLSSIIKHLYNTILPKSSPNGSNLLYRCLEDRYPSSQSDSSKGDLRSSYYDVLISRDRDDITYSTLKVWGLTSENNASQIFNLKQGEHYVRFLRKLLLDFMFDMMHSDVFQNSRYFDDVKQGLLSDFFFSAIIKKSEYYYWRAHVEKYVTSKSEMSKEVLRVLYIDSLDKAEQDWIDTISSPLAEKHFIEYGEWYDRNPEVERTSIPLLSKIKQTLQEIRMDNEQNKKITILNTWFVCPEIEMRRVAFELEGLDKCTTNIMRAFITEGLEQGTTDLNNRSKTISRWFYSRYDFYDAFRIHFWNNFSRGFFVVLSLILVYFIYLLGNSNLYFESWIANCLCGCTVFAILSSVYIIKTIKTKSEYNSHVDNSSHGLDCLWKKIYLKRKAEVFFAVATLMLFAFCPYGWVKWPAFIWGSLIMIKYIGSNLHLLLPRLIAAICTAWFTIALSEDLYRAFFDQGCSPVTIILLGMVVFVFVYYEINKVVPYKSAFLKCSRAIGLMIISYTISFVIGLLLINFTGELFLERCGFISDYYNDYVLLNSSYTDCSHIDSLSAQNVLDSLKNTVLNGHAHPSIIEFEFIHKNISILDKGYAVFILRDFLIQFAFIAMFIGIFIQMIFEEKNITES